MLLYFFSSYNLFIILITRARARARAHTHTHTHTHTKLFIHSWDASCPQIFCWYDFFSECDC